MRARAMTQLTRAQGRATAPARATWLVGSRDTNIVSWLGGGLVLRHNARHGAQRPATCSTARTTRRATGTCVAIQFCIVTGGEGREAATRCASGCVRAVTRQGTLATRLRGRPRHSRGRPTTRRRVCHDTAPSARYARRLGAVGAQLGSGCAPCAPNLVLTQDTILSHCLGHCS